MSDPTDYDAAIVVALEKLTELRIHLARLRVLQREQRAMRSKGLEQIHLSQAQPEPREGWQ